MVSINQTATVQQLETEGWVIVPAPDKLLLGGRVKMERTRDGWRDVIEVLPDGETVIKEP